MKFFLALLGLIASGRCFFSPQHALLGQNVADFYSTGGPFTPAFDRRVETVLDHFHVPAVSISVVNGNDTFAKGYGYAELHEEKATPETLYYCGSTTKSFTAAALLKLIEDSANHSKPLTLETKIQSLIRDEFVLPDVYATSQSTLEDALSHRTGVAAHDHSYGAPNATLEDLVKNLRHLPMTKQLRDQFQYCNMMFGVLSYIIEKMTGMWLGDFFREHIWAPLGMRSTFLRLADAQRAAANGGPKLAIGYVWDNDTKVYKPRPYNESPVISGAGSAISNVLDYAKYMRAMLIMDEAILSKKSYYELRTARTFSQLGVNGGLASLLWTGPEMYGLAWQISVYRGYEIFTHSGAITGFGVQTTYVPKLKDGVGISVMANTDQTSNAVALVLTLDLIDEMISVPEDDKHDVVGTFDALFEKKFADLQPDRARKRIYPNAQEPGSSAPTPLPLRDYTGEYWNDGYRNLSLSLRDASSSLPTWTTADKVLGVDALEKAFQHMITFEHVSGNYFLAWIVDANGDWRTAVVRPAEFQVGVDGKIQRLGINYMAETGGEPIWFYKRDSTPRL